MSLDNITAITGLLLTLATFLFNLAWPAINKSLNMDESIEGERARKRARDSINNVLWYRVSPILLAFFILFYVNLPEASKIITNSTLSFWKFNAGNTLYIMVVIALLCFVIYNFLLFVRIYKKRKVFSRVT